MTSRERIHAAINRTTPDRTPVDIGSTFATAVTAPAYDALRAELGLPCTRARMAHYGMLLVEAEPAVRTALGADTVGLYIGGGDVHGWQPWATPGGTQIELSRDLAVKPRADGGYDLFHDGAHAATMPPDGIYFDAVEYPMWRRCDPADLTDAVLSDLQTRARRCFEETDAALVLNVPYTIFNGTSPDFLCALLIEKDEVHTRLETWADEAIACLRLLLDAVGDTVAVMAFSGDAGTQRGPIIGPDLYREMILPHFRRIPAFLHAHSDIKFFYHTCGAVFPLIECFIELGVDILNPLQVSAHGMEAERLATEFGDRLVLWGGGIDAQHTLVEGSEADVRAKVRSQLDQFGRHPGYVFAFDHNIQPDVPPRNVLAALEEVRRERP